MVGRETELTQLHTWLDKALNGERQLVFVTGEPGIGKTALIEAFRQRLETGDWRLAPSSQAPSLKSLASLVSFAHGQCIEHYGAGEAYLPVLQALEELGQGAEAERDLLLTVLRQYAPSWLRQLPALVSPTERETLQQQTAGVTRERMLRELVATLEALTTHRSLVLILEDLHWSDPSTVDFLALLARRQGSARLLVIGTYRPVDVIVSGHPIKVMKQELEMHGQCQEVPLRLLSEGAVADYLAMRLPLEATHAQASLSQLARTIHQRTDGNPLFMVTVTNYALAQEVKSVGGAAVPEDFVRLLDTIPVELQQMITRQVEALTPEDQRLLDTASVVGAEFSAAAVVAGVGEDLVAVEGQCEQLARRGHVLQARGTAVWPDGTVAGRYGFLHALYQEVLYERLPAARRKQLHQRAGERIETAYGKRANEIASELAVHFERGGDYQRAVHYRHQAGENAVRRSAYVEAIAHLTRGLELLQTLPDTSERTQQELTLQLALNDALVTIKGYTSPEVQKNVTHAWKLCQQIGETSQIFPVLWRLWLFSFNQREFHKPRELAEQMMRVAQSVQDPYLLSLAHSALGPTLYVLGEFTSARTHLEQTIALYDPQKHPRPTFHTADPRVNCLSYASWTLWILGYPEQGLKRSHEALTLAAGLSHPFSLAYALWFTAAFHLFRREGQLARERAEAVMTLSTEQGFPYWLAAGTIVRDCWALAEQGQEQEGIAQMRQSRNPYLLVLLAGAYSKVGRIEEGLTVLAKALTQVEKTEERFSEAELYRLRGELTLQSQASPEEVPGKSKTSQKSKVKTQNAKVTDSRPLTPDPQGEAEACFLKAIDIARKQQAKSLELRAVMSLSRLWQSQGKQREAHQMLAEVYNWFTEGFDTKDLQEAKALLDSLESGV